MRALLVTATLIVAGTLTTACGGDGGSDAPKAAATPSAATTEEFCTSYNSLYDAFPAGTQPTDKEAVAAIKKWAGDMEATGTPQDIPADAKKGFDLVTATIGDIAPDATQADIQKMSDDLTAAEQKQSQAFGAYATKTCPMPGTPGESPAPSN